MIIRATLRNARPDEALEAELELAIGLVWGHLQARQFDQAYQLAKGCLLLWPKQRHLNAMAAYAQLEAGFEIPAPALKALHADGADAGWSAIMLRRAGNA
ncbi:hypothetical protein [Janthinobacterium agaricidamnosum]|uniref:Uncharacterized protein n=1 Tax=Janthinobacterium agaricidamnosum NBRC 102515 = DSM 9628 TaxID=1349767 RepID=W0V0D7_9BURK|nr:hypothetical protein [Janthinobacterium agaricidamnosum]CDG82294.1 hypothetical protein GJA_1656 [Janthinobacterium agaricidamnosum NBRC 102515 = DSM 9628]